MSFVESDLHALAAFGRKDLEERWRDLFRASPPIAYTPDLLRRGIAYHMQERAKDGLSKPTLDRLKVRTASSANKRTLRPGNRLVRRWRGKDYVVEVRDDGLEHDGQHFDSLSEIATFITGTRWSGPRFFGLKT